MTRSAPAVRVCIAALLGVTLLAGCSTQQAGTPVTGVSTGAPAGSASSSSTPSSAAPTSPVPTTSSASSSPDQPATVPSPTTASDSPATVGPKETTLSTASEPTGSEPTGSAATGATVQAKNPECGDYREMVLSYEISEGKITDYRWWLTLTPGEKADFKVETGDSMKSWGYDVPADLERDVALCDAVAGNGNGSGDLVGSKRASVEITLADGDNGRAALNDDMVPGFEQLVLDELPVVLIEKVNAELTAWQEQQQESTAVETPAVPTGAEPTGAEPTTATSGTRPGAIDAQQPCTPSNLMLITFDNGESDPATFYEWKLTVSSSAIIMLMTVGPPDDQQVEGVSFPLEQGQADELCRRSWQAATAGNPTGTSGPAASVMIADSAESRVTEGVADPIALQDMVLEYVPDDKWNVLWNFYSEYSASQDGG